MKGIEKDLVILHCFFENEKNCCFLCLILHFNNHRLIMLKLLLNVIELT